MFSHLFLLYSIFGCVTTATNFRTGIHASSANQTTDTNHVLLGQIAFNTPDALERRQTGRCEIPGDVPCPQSTSFCCPPGDDCLISMGICCPKGSIICQNPNGCCASTQKCCGFNGCCDRGSTCCETVCCLPGSVCKERVVLSYEVRETTLYKNDKKKYKVDNKAVLMNICRGIEKATGKTAQSMTLTYNKDMKQTRKNRRKMCPEKKRKSFCRNATDFYGKVHNLSTLKKHFRFTCDEFPPANSAEGGNTETGSSWCVQGWENFWAGGKLGPVLQTLGSDAPYVVQVTGWNCTTGKPTVRRKRDDVVLSQEDGLSDGDLFMDYIAPGKNALLLSVGDLDAGSYTFRLSIASGIFDEAFVFDYVGTPHAKITKGFSSADGQTTVSFILDEEAIGVGLVAVTNDSAVRISYVLKNDTLPVSTPTGDTKAKETSGSNGLKRNSVLAGAVAVLQLAGLLVGL